MYLVFDNKNSFLQYVRFEVESKDLTFSTFERIHFLRFSKVAKQERQAEVSKTELHAVVLPKPLCYGPNERGDLY